jgi:hypothetical protein
LALTSPTIGGRSVGIVRLRIKATEFSFTVLDGSANDSLSSAVVIFVKKAYKETFLKPKFCISFGIECYDWIVNVRNGVPATYVHDRLNKAVNRR